jgi:hypothetical protein
VFEQKATQAFNADFIRLYETQLAWLIHVVASLISSQALPGLHLDVMTCIYISAHVRIFQVCVYLLLHVHFSSMKF